MNYGFRVSTKGWPYQALITVARDDDTTFGIRHSRLHELWSLRMCTYLGVGNDPRYTPTTCFETFPFPQGLTPDLAAADYADDPRAIRISDAARELVAARDRWLNPPEWTERVPEVVPGFPDRILAKPGFEAALKQRTLTNLYNARPAWRTCTTHSMPPPRRMAGSGRCRTMKSCGACSS